MISIYKLIRNNIPFYIGKTIDPKHRLNAHRLTYGTDIDMKILEVVKNKDWESRESYWINEHKNYKLLNKNEGGGGPKAGTRTKESIEGFKEKRKTWSRKGTPQPETYKKRIQMALKGVPKPEGFGDMMREVRKGVPKPEGHGAKISAKTKGKPHQTKYKPVLCYSKDGLYIMEYVSIKEAAEKTNSNTSSISKVCRGIFKQTNGYKFKYK